MPVCNIVSPILTAAIGESCKKANFIFSDPATLHYLHKAAEMINGMKMIQRKTV